MIDVVIPDLTIGDDDYLVRASVTLDGVLTRLALQWMERLERWAVHLVDDSGAPVSLQQIVQPGGEMLVDTRSPFVPPGRLVWFGPDSYVRSDMGTRLRLWYVPA